MNRLIFYRFFRGAGGLFATGTVITSVDQGKKKVSQTNLTLSENGKRRVLLPGYQLEQVHVLVRHGARTPLHLIANVEEVEYSKPFFLDDVPHTTYNYSVQHIHGGPRPQSKYDENAVKHPLKGGALPGQLTKLGQDQMYIKGRLLRQQYIEEASLLEPEFNPEQVYIRSTNIKRTIATARCILAGMYGRDNLNKLPKAPVIHVERLEVDPLIPQTGSCRTLRQINHAAMIHGGDIPGIKEDRLLVEELLGIKEPDSDKKHKINFIDIRDDIAARETHGLLEVKSLAPLREVIEINASKVMFFAFCGQHEAEQQVAMQLSTGPVLKMLIETIDSSENDRTKFYLYSCHDSTLVGLLGALDVYDYQWPPFGADIRLEVYRRDGNQFIRVSYNGKDVKVRGCSSELCPFEEFKEAMGPYVINESQFRQICDSNILEEIAQEMLAQEKDEEEDEETAKRSETPAGM